MKVLYSWLKDYTDYKGSAEDAAVLLTEHSYEVEGIDVVGKDSILNIDVLANRAVDSLSHIGVARELAAVSGASFIMPAIELNEVGNSAGNDVSIKIQDEELCPRYIGRVVRDITAGESPKWLKDRLEALGQRSINNIVDATNYVMFEYGQPLHAFDAKNLEGASIVVRLANKGETLITLDGEDVELGPEMLVIADAVKPLAIAGIKGGKEAEIDENTKTLVLESAVFNPTSVRRTARAIGIQTESSRRFEAGVDLVRPVEAIDRVAQLIVEVAGGSVAPGCVDVGRKPKGVVEINVRPEDVQKLLGIEIEMDAMIVFLERLQFTAKEDAGFLVVAPPSFRQDIKTAPDVIEEIVRLYGYNSIPSLPPLAHLVPLAQSQDYDVELLIREALIGFGMVEVRNYSFVSEEESAWVRVGTPVAVENALSNDLAFLRTSLLPGILKTVSHNVKLKEVFRLFEIGDVFKKGSKSDSINEETRLAGAFVHTSQNADLFYELKGVLASLLDRIGIIDYLFDSSVSDLQCMISSRFAEIYAGDIRIGFIGEINRDSKLAFGVDASVVIFEFDLSILVNEIEEGRGYTKFSRYPTVVRDVALMVPIDTKVSSILNVIESSGAQWVVDVDLFDMYDGDEIGESLKSLAFHIVYQSDEKTLTDEEVNAEYQKIVDKLQAEGWETR